MGKNEIVRRHSSSICVSTFTSVLAYHCKVKFDQHFGQRVMVTIDLNLADTKLKSFKAYLLKLGEKLMCRRVLKLFTFFAKMRF